jgi:hypothetical protein
MLRRNALALDKPWWYVVLGTVLALTTRVTPSG